MATQDNASRSRGKSSEDPSSLLGRLHLEEDELDNLVWEEEVEEPEEKPKWLALTRVLTEKSFGQGALIADMKAAWNPAREVVWRRINPNFFSVQFNCLADWNKAIHQGPWDFKGMALIIAEYDRFKKPETVKFDKIETWCQIHKLPHMVLKREQFVKNMAARVGEVTDLQIVLPNGFVGEFIRARVKLDVNKKLTRFVGFTKAGETEFYQVKFEKLPIFFYMCGLLGHWHEECGTGEHDVEKMEWGPFIMAPKRGRGGRGRGSGRGNGRGGQGNFDADPSGNFGRGRGAGRAGTQYEKWTYNAAFNPEGDPETVDAAMGQHLVKSWRFNANNPMVIEPKNAATDKDVGQEGTTMDMNVLGKRAAENSATHERLTTVPLALAGPLYQ